MPKGIPKSGRKPGNPNLWKSSPWVQEKQAKIDAMRDPEKRAQIGQMLLEVLEAYQQPQVKSNEELEERLANYFYRCADRDIYPTVEEMCLYTGYDIRTVLGWESGEHSPFGPGTSLIIKKAKAYLQSYDSKAVTAGKQNPVVYIFRAKNYYGMKDQQDINVNADPLGQQADERELAAEYLGQLPTDASSVPEAIDVDFVDIPE